MPAWEAGAGTSSGVTGNEEAWLHAGYEVGQWGAAGREAAGRDVASATRPSSG